MIIRWKEVVSLVSAVLAKVIAAVEIVVVEAAAAEVAVQIRLALSA